MKKAVLVLVMLLTLMSTISAAECSYIKNNKVIGKKNVELSGEFIDKLAQASIFGLNDGSKFDLYIENGRAVIKIDNRRGEASLIKLTDSEIKDMLAMQEIYFQLLCLN